MKEEVTPLTKSEVLKANLFSVRISPPEYKKQRAFTLIKEYFELGEAIPLELGSFLIDACDYQLKNLGNAATNRVTDDKWRSRVINVEMLRRCGYTVEAAIKAIVSKDGKTYKASSLKTKRKAYKEEREPEYINKEIFETFKLYGGAETDLSKIILEIS